MMKLSYKVQFLSYYSLLRMLYHTREPLKTLDFEDFSIRDYSMLERQIDLNTATMSFERLGKYHACSYILYGCNFKIFAVPGEIMMVISSLISELQGTTIQHLTVRWTEYPFGHFISRKC